ncbi:MAG: hypothetical protein ABGZ17_15635, partial [Planctomycetaceae bacterium]
VELLRPLSDGMRRLLRPGMVRLGMVTLGRVDPGVLRVLIREVGKDLELLRPLIVNPRVPELEERDRDARGGAVERLGTETRGVVRPLRCLDEACLDEVCLDEVCLDEVCLDEVCLKRTERLLDFWGVSAAQAVPLTRTAANTALQIAEWVVLQNIDGAP